MSESTPTPAREGPWLVIEAATAAGSVALLDGLPNRAGPRVPAGNPSTDHAPPRVLAAHAVPMGSGRQDLLTPAVSALLAEAGHAVRDLSAIVCGAGPGSFTSLRIAASLAKGLAYGLSVPLYAVPSLLLAVGNAEAAPPPGRTLVILDALRDERFVQPVEVSAEGLVRAGGPVTRVAASALDETLGEADAQRLVDAGETAPRAEAARWLADWPSYGPVSLDDWEPAYGRLAEAQVKWEAAHGRALPTG